MSVAMVCMVNHTAGQSAAILSGNDTTDSYTNNTCADSTDLIGNNRVSSPCDPMFQCTVQNTVVPLNINITYFDPDS